MSVENKVEILWNRLRERLDKSTVAEWDKQPRNIQDMFIQGINTYSSLGDYSMCFMTFEMGVKT